MLLTRPALPALSLLLLAVTEQPLLAAEAAPAAAGVPAPSAAGCSRERGSLAYIGCSLASALLPGAASAEVVVVELKTDRALPAPDSLRERVREAVRVALAQGATAAATGGERAKLRVELRLEKSAGVLRVTADVRRATGLWQRLRGVKQLAVAHGFVEAPIDAELRGLIPPPPLVVSEVLKVRAPERGVVALACGVLGTEGGLELALVSRSSVRVGRIAGRAFAERSRVAWSSLSPVAGAPLREPIATAEITPQGLLRVGITDRRDGVALNGDLAVVARYSGRLPAPGGGCTAPSGVGLAGTLTGCSSAEPAPGKGFGETLDALTGIAGSYAGREQATGKLRATRREPKEPVGAGAQLALGDGDGDGVWELAYSADVQDGTRDRLTLVSLGDQRAVQRFELAAPSISAVAICSKPEGPGMAPIALISDDELWLIR